MCRYTTLWNTRQHFNNTVANVPVPPCTLQCCYWGRTNGIRHKMLQMCHGNAKGLHRATRTNLVFTAGLTTTDVQQKQWIVQFTWWLVGKTSWLEVCRCWVDVPLTVQHSVSFHQSTPSSLCYADCSDDHQPSSSTVLSSHDNRRHWNSARFNYDTVYVTGLE